MGEKEGEGFCFQQMEWPNENKLFEFWKCEPCCGDPCTPGEGVYCCCLFYVCGPCSNAKLFAASRDEKCLLKNHFLHAWCCSHCTGVAVRFNYRMKTSGSSDYANATWVPDCVLSMCCGLCSTAQVLRATQKTDWDWAKDFEMPPFADEAVECGFPGCRSA